MALSFEIIEILYLFAAFHGLFLAILIILKRPAKQNVYIFLLVLLFSFYLTENVIYSSGYIRQLPHFYFVTLPLIFLIGPLFYTYLRAGLDDKFRLKWKDLIHLLPFFFELIILIPFYRLSGAIKIRIYEMSMQPSEDFTVSIFFVGYLIYIGSTFWYFFASYRQLRNHGLNLNAKNRRKIKWLKMASAGFFTYMFLNLVLSILIRFIPEIIPFFFHANLICLTILIHGIGYAVFMSPELFSESGASNYTFSNMGEDKLRMLGKQLREVMEKDKPHLQSEISAEEIGKLLDITKHQLSQLLNVGMNTTFYDFVNEYRIAHSKEILCSPEYRDAKILHIAFDSGFSNKASFLRNFKKQTGLTPTEYKNLQQKQVSIN